MDEHILVRISLLTSILGFVLLTCLVLLVKPSFVAAEFIPTDEEVVLRGEISSIYTTQKNASILILERVIPTSVYVDTYVAEEYLGQKVNISGNRNEDLFIANIISVE